MSGPPQSAKPHRCNSSHPFRSRITRSSRATSCSRSTRRRIRSASTSPTCRFASALAGSTSRGIRGSASRWSAACWRSTPPKCETHRCLLGLLPKLSRASPLLLARGARARRVDGRSPETRRLASQDALPACPARHRNDDYARRLWRWWGRRWGGPQHRRRAGPAVDPAGAAPSVNFVAPYVVPAGAGGDVIIRGRGFSALSPDTLSVRFNSTLATTAVVVSDTEIHATYPSLAAGSYSISVGSGATSIPSRAALKLVVIDPPAFPLHAIPRPASAGQPANLIYDAERQALLFIDETNHRILRYALSGG